MVAFIYLSHTKRMSYLILSCDNVFYLFPQLPLDVYVKRTSDISFFLVILLSLLLAAFKSLSMLKKNISYFVLPLAVSAKRISHISFFHWLSILKEYLIFHSSTGYAKRISDISFFHWLSLLKEYLIFRSSIGCLC